MKKSGRLELRQYAGIPVASAPMGGMESQDGSFMKLFRYIQGGNEKNQKIEMTAPVFMETTLKDQGESKGGRMSFMIPAEVAARGAPSPSGGDVELRTIGGGKVAVIRFKGHRSGAKRAAAVKELEAWVKGRG
ncbi:MAG: heme-binding protein, partial [Akkermansiaceae bacterium]|nr:heme-binding protein [Akkermansiaceae bacterium]